MATIEEIESQLQQREQQSLISNIEAQLAVREKELSKAETPTPFFDEVGRTFLNNLLSIPSVGGEIVAKGMAGTAAALEGSISALTGGKFDFERRAQRNVSDDILGVLNTIPRPTVEGIEAGIGAFREEFPKTVPPFEQLDPSGRPIADPVAPLSERLGPAFDEELERVNQEQARLAEKFSFKVGAGKVGGDVLSIVAGRLPFAKGINTAEAAFVAKKFSDSLTKPGTRKLVENILDSKAVRSLKQGAGRAVETGAEASVLALVKEGDPLETAAFAAGGQIVGSGILTGIKGVGRHPILASAFGMAALIQMAKETTPGGSDNFIASLESGFEKVWWGLMLGAVSAVAGAGRLRGGDLAKNLPKFTDALATIPRATSISLLQDYLNATPEEQQTIDATLKQIQQDPEFFGPEITDRLLKALQAGNLTSALRE